MFVVGVGAGAHGARAILTRSDGPHRAPVASRAVRRLPGRSPAAPITDAIAELHSIASKTGAYVSSSAVTYRSTADAELLDALPGPRLWQLVPETTAQLRYLRFTGTVPAHGVTVLCDLGSTGTTISVVDLAESFVLSSRRTATFCGDDLDQLVRRRLAEGGIRTDTDSARSIKEQLSTVGVVSARDLRSRRSLAFTRGDFDALIAGPLRHAAILVQQTVELSGARPASVVLLGGGAVMPTVAATFEALVGGRTVVPNHPELVSARGAALLSITPTIGKRMRPDVFSG